MRTLGFLLTVVCVIASAFWAYHENYKTQEAYAETRSLQREIGAARSRLAVLKAEWAYLNRPERLHELADLNFERLGLLPLSPKQFGHVDEVSYPATGQSLLKLDFADSVEVSSEGTEQ